ncbi:MAG: hypothetical protein ACR2LN_07270 [Candidatus Levyibacteriota bacterium]
MGKEVLFIPGRYRQQNEYAELVTGLKETGNNVHPLTFNWHGNPNFHTLANQVQPQIEGHRFDTVIGHSNGAVLALLTTKALGERSPTKLILCSTSPVFKDDFEDPAVRELTMRENNGHIPDGYNTMQIEELTGSITSREEPKEWIIFAGEKELRVFPPYRPIMHRRTHTIANRLGTNAIIVSGAPHYMFESSYPANMACILTRESKRSNVIYPI